MNENPRILVFLENDNSRFVETGKSGIRCFVENGNPRILVLWDSRMGEVSFCGK